MNGDHEEIVKILCQEDWGKMPQEVFQAKVGKVMSYLLQRSMRLDFMQLGIVTASGFFGGAAVWIVLILTSGNKIFAG